MKAQPTIIERPLSASVAQIADAAAKTHRVSASLVRAVIWVESRGNVNVAASSKGARGLMQLMPNTAAELGVDPGDPVQNVDGGTRYLAQMLRKYRGDEGLALAAYNWGTGNVDGVIASDGKLRIPTQVQGYVSKVLERRNLEEGTRGAAAPLSRVQLCISCPWCSKGVVVDSDLIVVDVGKQ